ncbi:MAG: Smr/MutS family protein [Candidatus Rokubacteria bacterium]|nr:Smr/MutS family protein [Candidatus Rokubacteria bacterium]
MGRLWGRGVEWDEVRALLAHEADTPMGQEQALTLEPATESGAIRQALTETREGRQALAEAGPPPWGALPDVRPSLERARVPEALLEGPELAALVPLIEAGSRLRAYGRGAAPVAPRLAVRFSSLPSLTPLHELLSRSLTPEGTLTDEASPRLRTIRRKIREQRAEIVKVLEALFHSRGAETTFQDRYVTLRHGRYVVPVRAEALPRLKGIVHDRSQSGATLFVEPERVVEMNNGILQALTDEVRAALPELDTLVEGIGDLDLIFARAEMAEHMEATEPEIDAGRTIALTQARHPLLLAQSWKEPGRPVVPVDLHLDADRPLLLVTGPNAGGKTVALKTLGLLSLMAQAGCHLPVNEGSRLPVLSRLFAVIGDDQSVAENLSTFSAFVKQVREILEQVDDRSLVLLDELGAGTDPDEGAALAQAILEDLQLRGALVMATTHLEPLKAFASTHRGARNASVEFDGARLAPTFRLLYDRPGQSYALTIAARLGLHDRLIDRAHSHRSTQARNLQELLQRLDAEARQSADRAAEAQRRESQAAALLARAQKEIETAQAKAKEIVARAKAEAQALLADIKRKIAEEWERLKSKERSKRALEATRKRLAEAAPPAPPAPARTVVLTPSWRDKLRESVRMPEKTDVPDELMLIGKTTDEGRDLVEKYLDDAFLAGRRIVRLVHGKGTGALRKAVHELLAVHPLVESFRPGTPNEGGGGATVVELKVD